MSTKTFLLNNLVDRTIFQRLSLIRLHPLLSHDQQLADFTFSPVRTAHGHITALSLWRQRSNNSTQTLEPGTRRIYNRMKPNHRQCVQGPGG